MGLDGSSDHRAFYEPERDGRWRGGCKTCGTEFHGATEEGAGSWVSGHDSAVACQRRVASKDTFFPLAGPNMVPNLGDLRRLIDEAIERFGGDRVEILQPADQSPWLFLWTPPTEEGWHRERLGGFHLSGSGGFVPEPSADAQAGAPRCESCGAQPAHTRTATTNIDPWWLCDDCDERLG